MPSLTRALTRCWRLLSMLLHNDSYTGSPGVGNMNQLTVRGFDDQLVDRIRRLAMRVLLDSNAYSRVMRGHRYSDVGRGRRRIALRISEQLAV